MSKKKSKTWGGRRKGAGRKRLVKDGCSLSIWIPRRVREKLDKEAKRNGESVTALARRVLKTARPDLPW